MVQWRQITIKMAANQDLSYATKISFIRNRGNFHLQAVDFSYLLRPRQGLQGGRLPPRSFSIEFQMWKVWV